MTEADKNRITELRKQGLGYKKISSQLNLNPNTVKSCIRKLEQERPGVRCRQCGMALVSVRRKDACFCSRECRKKWWNTHRCSHPSAHVKEHVCAGCGKTFLANTKANRKYCSISCYADRRFHDGRSHA